VISGTGSELPNYTEKSIQGYRWCSAPFKLAGSWDEIVDSCSLWKGQLYGTRAVVVNVPTKRIESLWDIIASKFCTTPKQAVYLVWSTQKRSHAVPVFGDIEQDGVRTFKMLCRFMKLRTGE